MIAATIDQMKRLSENCAEYLDLREGQKPMPLSLFSMFDIIPERGHGGNRTRVYRFCRPTNYHFSTWPSAKAAEPL